jgi:hypothetical protein
MTTTHDDTATTWRDLADQLTPEQIQMLTDREADEVANEVKWRGDGNWLAKWLVAQARDCAQTNLTERLHFGHLPRPADAVAVYAVVELGDGIEWSRVFAGTKREVGDVSVRINGTQYAELSVTVDRPFTDCGILEPSAARDLAAALIEAADEMERRSEGTG